MIQSLKNLSFNQKITILLSITLLIVSIFSSGIGFYYAAKSDELNKANIDLQKTNLYLQNLTYNFEPYVYSNYTRFNILNTTFWNPTNGIGYFFGIIYINLEVISPYDGLLTINASSLKFNHFNETSTMQSILVDSELVNNSSIECVQMTPEGYQYFINKGTAVHIQDKILVTAGIYLKPNSWNTNYPPSITVDFGDVIFQANMHLFQTNSDIKPKYFPENVQLQLFPST